MAISARTDINYPRPPRNPFAVHPFISGALDIRFDNPGDDPENRDFEVVGVNVYKAHSSEFGRFKRLTDAPLTSLTYRDRTLNELVIDEDVTANFVSRGDNERKEYIFKVSKRPIVKNLPVLAYADSNSDIVVKIDNGDGQLLETPIYKVVGATGEVFLITSGYFDNALRRLVEPRLPDFENPQSKVTCEYYHNVNAVPFKIDHRIFYKLTTVANVLDEQGQIIETLESPLDQSEPVTFQQVETINWYWREAIRRNRWLLQQSGERVKVFIRKWMGTRCPDWDDTHKRSYAQCPICYGTGYVGGYEGPFDILIAPPEAEKNLELGEAGIRLNYSFETWTGPSPLLSQRDFIVRGNGERFSVGPITPEGSQGAIFLQHFPVQYIDTKDIIYKVPVNPAATIDGPIPKEDDFREKPGVTTDSPVITNKPEIPDSREIKGRSPNFEDITY